MRALPFQQRHPGLVWSNGAADEAVLIRAALLHPRYHTLLDACLEFGLDRVRGEWATITEQAPDDAARVRPEVVRMLHHIAQGFADAQA